MAIQYYKSKHKNHPNYNKITLWTTILLVVGLFNSYLYSNTKLLFKPLVANHLESRIGCFYQYSAKKLRLDIGHSLDMINICSKPISSNSALDVKIGGDFFILSRLRSEGNMKFPVETSDFYFGLNCSGTFSKNPAKTSLINNTSFRLRIAHISSHLVDGYTDNNTFIQEPFVYSREFVDLVLAYNTEFVRPYIGVTTIFSTIPKGVNKFIPQAGFDFHIPLLSINSPFNIKAIGGYDFKLSGTKNLKTIGCNSIQAGLALNLLKNVDISINYYHYSGYSIHGMFHNTKENYNGFGIQINY